MTPRQGSGPADPMVRQAGEVLGFPRVLGLLAGAEGFRVVHGRGTGVLRRRLREHLGEEPQVRSWHPSQGDAATWVDIG